MDVARGINKDGGINSYLYRYRGSVTSDHRAKVRYYSTRHAYSYLGAFLGVLGNKVNCSQVYVVYHASTGDFFRDFHHVGFVDDNVVCQRKR